MPPNQRVKFRLDTDDWVRVMRDLRQFAPDTKREFVREIRGILKNVVERAQILAPYRHGTLSRSIKPSVRTRSIGIVATAPHARQEEFGGSHPLFGDPDYKFPDDAHHYMFTAARESRRDAERSALDAIDKALRKANFK